MIPAVAVPIPFYIKPISGLAARSAPYMILRSSSRLFTAGPERARGQPPPGTICSANSGSALAWQRKAPPNGLPERESSWNLYIAQLQIDYTCQSVNS